MKTIGLIGGMSWQSTAVYYHRLNEMVANHLGGLHSAKILLWSFDFAEIAVLQAKNEWQNATDLMIDAAKRLEHGGADAIVICTNTMHKMADDVQSATDIPLIHIGDVTADAILKAGKNTPLLLGTNFTMTGGFYADRLKAKGINAIIPKTDDCKTIHSIIFQELCQGKILADSKQKYLEIIAQYPCDSVIFGCTEIGLLLGQDDLSIPAFDTTELHTEAGFQFQIGE